MLRKLLFALGLLIPSIVLGNVSIWTVPATVKILSDADAPGQGAKSFELFAARREVAAFQIALRSAAAAPKISVSAAAFAGPSVIAADRITLWREHSIATSAGARPDPLTFLDSVDLAANVVQPIFVEVDVPPDAAPGDYTSTLTVRTAGQSIAAVEIHLHVYDFEIPLTPTLRTAFGNNDECIAAMEHIEATGEVFQQYRRKYYEILLAHRISPYTIPEDLMSDRAERYLADPRMTSFTIPYSEDDSRLTALCDHLRQRGWFSRGYFYVVDEPSTVEGFANLDKAVQRLKKLVPDYKLVAQYCANPQFKTDKDVYDYLSGRVNIWCYITSIHGYHTDKLNAHRAAGEEIWSYVAWTPLVPYANFQIQNGAMQNRILPWQNWKYRTTGLLYWSTDFWSNNDGGTRDPWKDMATVKWASKDVFGDGSLLYPGHPVNHPGPLPSLRLKLLRQGLQDYEYLHLAAGKAGDAPVRTIVDQLTPSWTQYATDDSALERAKGELAKLILKR